jgi:hypothetical protein
MCCQYKVAGNFSRKFNLEEVNPHQDNPGILSGVITLRWGLLVIGRNASSMPSRLPFLSQVLDSNGGESIKRSKLENYSAILSWVCRYFIGLTEVTGPQRERRPKPVWKRML